MENNFFKYSIPLIALLGCNEPADNTDLTSAIKNVTSVNSLSVDSGGNAGQLTPQSELVLSNARTILSSSELVAAVDEFTKSNDGTPFEKEVLTLLPTVRRLAELSSIKNEERNVNELSEISLLIAKIQNNSAAKRLVELSQEQPMNCVQFLEISAKLLPRITTRLDESSRQMFQQQIETCATTGGVVSNLWSGFSDSDWHSRIVLDSEELARSEVENTVAFISGAIVLVGAVILAVVPGTQGFALAATAVGVNLITVGIAGEIDFGGTCEFIGAQGCDYGTSTSALILSNGCLKGAPQCSSDQECGSGTLCTHGCCEGFSSGFVKNISNKSAYLVVVNYPKDVKLNEMAIWSLQGSNVNDRSKVLLHDGTGASVVTAATSGRGRLGVDSKVGSFFTDGSLHISDRAIVDGDLLISGEPLYNNKSTVKVGGQIITGPNAISAQRPAERLMWLTTFSDGLYETRAIEPDQIVHLTPGDYGSYSLKSRAKLVLSPGLYHFDGFNAEPESVIEVSGGPVLTKLDVRGSISLKGTIKQSGTIPTFVLTYVDSRVVYVSEGFSGALVAPYAPIVLDFGSDKVFRGTVWGKTVELHQGSTVQLPKETVWESFSSSDLAHPVQ